ncbi:hypothetical protein KC359_g8910 [Hortaea werneckii]|nr:hypothetical protein KC359_g8910 [Hortaea werneckii]
MHSSSYEKMRKIPRRRRDVIKPTKLNEIQHDIRNKCVDATLNMLRQMYPISDRSTYDDIVRGMLLIAFSTPIKCICVGINPYENGILPPFATALAYSPRKCIGVTPSVQAMSQIMSLCAMEEADKYANQSQNMYEGKYPTRDEFTAKFAMMLRCSYSCAEAGVAFVNSSPIITSSISRRNHSQSLFSEWIANIILIHSSHGYRMSVLSMGASADESLDDALGSYPDLSSSMELIRTMNPAGISRMSVRKTETRSPIPDGPSPGELVIDSIVNKDVIQYPCAGFQWVKYDNSILRRFIGTNSVRKMVARLAGDTPDRLVNQTVITIQKLYDKMSEYDLESMLENMGVNEGATAGVHEDITATANTGPIHQATTNDSSNQQMSTQFNPFESANMQTAPNPSQGGGQSSNQRNQNSEGPYMFPKKSQLEQLLDPTGKGVSQQTIVIDNFNKYATQILTSYRQLTHDTGVLAQRQAQVADLMNKFESFDKDMIEEVNDFNDEYRTHMEEVLKQMEEARGLIRGLHAVVEGDRGIYEPETMIVAPLLRREDGNPMKQFVYGPANRNANMNMNSNQFQSMDPNPQPQSQTVEIPNMNNPFNEYQNDNPDVMASMNTSLLETGNKEYDAIASKSLKQALKQTEFGSGMSYKKVLENLKNYEVKVGNIGTNMFEIMKTLVSQKMSLNSGTNLNEDDMNDLIDFLDEGTNANVAECETFFVDAIKNETTIERFFKNMNEHRNDDDDADSNQTETESEDEDE